MVGLGGCALAAGTRAALVRSASAVAATTVTERAASCVSARWSALDCDLAWRARDDFGRTGVVAHESSHTDRAPSILDLWSSEGRSVLDPDDDADPCRVWVRAADVEKCGRAIARRSELRAGHSPDESRNAPLEGDSLLPTDGAVARHRCRSEDERAGGRGAGSDYTRGNSGGNHPDGEEGSLQDRSCRRRGHVDPGPSARRSQRRRARRATP